MHRPSIRTAAITLLLGLLILPSLSASPGARGRGPASGGAAADAGVDELAAGRLGPRLARYLELSDEQIAASRDLLADLRTSVQPLREQQHALRDQLGDQLDAETPDAAAIGQTVIAAHELGEQIRAARASFESSFRALLTADQVPRYDALREVLRFLRGRDGRGGNAELVGDSLLP